MFCTTGAHRLLIKHAPSLGTHLSQVLVHLVPMRGQVLGLLLEAVPGLLEGGLQLRAPISSMDTPCHSD